MRLGSKLAGMVATGAVAVVCGVAAAGQDPASVSMVDLLANEERYVARVIEVVGYLHVDTSLYLTKEHAEAFDGLSAVLVSDTSEGDITSSPCIGSYVRVRGKLIETDPQSYVLVGVNQIFQPSTNSFCWKRP